MSSACLPLASRTSPTLHIVSMLKNAPDDVRGCVAVTPPKSLTTSVHGFLQLNRLYGRPQLRFLRNCSSLAASLAGESALTVGLRVTNAWASGLTGAFWIS